LKRNKKEQDFDVKTWCWINYVNA